MCSLCVCVYAREVCSIGIEKFWRINQLWSIIRLIVGRWVSLHLWSTNTSTNHYNYIRISIWRILMPSWAKPDKHIATGYTDTIQGIVLIWNKLYSANVIILWQFCDVQYQDPRKRKWKSDNGSGGCETK